MVGSRVFEIGQPAHHPGPLELQPLELVLQAGRGIWSHVRGKEVEIDQIAMLKKGATDDGDHLRFHHVGIGCCAVDDAVGRARGWSIGAFDAGDINRNLDPPQL